MERIWIFQHDNDPKHKAKLTCHWLQQNKVKVLEWPSQSPDLNIIEPLWEDLKCAVHTKQPKNLQELEAFCQEEWAALPSEKIKSLIHNYHKRLQAVTDVKGGCKRPVDWASAATGISPVKPQDTVGFLAAQTEILIDCICFFCRHLCVVCAFME